MRRALALAAALAALCAGPALAQSTTYNADQHGVVGTPITVNDPSGNPRKVLLPHFVCDSGCSGSSGGGENQPPGVTVPVTAVTYSQGQSLGGLIQVTSGSTGIITYLGLRSVDGVTIGIADYIFAKQPTATTCTNGSAFVLGAADRPYLVGGGPVALTPSASGVGSADTATYAQLQNQTLNFVQQDTSAGTVLYHCLVAQAAIGTALTANGMLLFQGNTQG